MAHDPKRRPSLIEWASSSESDAAFLLNVANAWDTGEGKGLDLRKTQRKLAEKARRPGGEEVEKSRVERK
jgi:hypothetical protein